LVGAVLEGGVQQLLAGADAARGELVVVEFRQLRGAEHDLVAHEQRRIDLGIAMFVHMQIEHELADGALQPRNLSLEHHEARAGKPARRLEIHALKSLAEIEMLFRVVDARRRSNAAQKHVAAFIGAERNILERQVGDGGEPHAQFRFDLLLPGLGGGDAILHASHLTLESLGLRHVLGGHGLADRLRGGVA
jgi:hypothetical protein